MRRNKKSQKIVGLFLFILITSLFFEHFSFVKAEESGVPLKIMLEINNIEWLGNQTEIDVIARINNITLTNKVNADKNNIIITNFTFEGQMLPATFSIVIVSSLDKVVEITGIIIPTSIKVYEAKYNESLVKPIEGKDVLIFMMYGHVLSITCTLPLKDQVKVVSEVNGQPVESELQEGSNGTKVTIKNIIFSQSEIPFIIKFLKNNATLGYINGSVGINGLNKIFLSGVIEKVKVAIVISSGPERSAIPSSIFKSFKVDEVGRIEKTIEMTVTSIETFSGNVKVRLLALSKSLLGGVKPVEKAIFYVTIPRLNVTKIYSNNDTANLLEGEETIITVRAEGYQSQERRIIVNKSLSLLEFYLEPVNPSILDQIAKSLTMLYNNQYILAVIIGVILAMIILIIIIRKRGD